MLHTYRMGVGSPLPLVNIVYTDKIRYKDRFVNPIKALIRNTVPPQLDEFYIDNMCNLLFYTNLLQDQFDEYKQNKKTIQDMETVLVGFANRRKFHKFLMDQSCLMFEDALVSKQVNGRADPFETLRTLDQNPNKMNIVKSGHSDSEQRQLDAAIALLKKQNEEESKKKLEQDKQDQSGANSPGNIVKGQTTQGQGQGTFLPEPARVDKKYDVKPEVEHATPSSDKEIVERVRDLTKQDNVQLQDLQKELQQKTTKGDLLSSKPEDQLMTGDSYIPSDTHKMLSITADELTALQSIEDKVIQQMKLDKELYQQNKNRLKQLVIDKQREIDDKLSKQQKANSIKSDNLRYQQDVMEKYYQEQKELLQTRARMIEQKRQKDKQELSRLKQSYVKKLNAQYNRALDDVSKQYEGQLKQQRVLLEELVHNDEWKKSREGENVYLKELTDKLQGTYQTPVMEVPRKKRTIKKVKRSEPKKKTAKKKRNDIKQANPGVDTIKTLINAR